VGGGKGRERERLEAAGASRRPPPRAYSCKSEPERKKSERASASELHQWQQVVFRA